MLIFLYFCVFLSEGRFWFEKLPKEDKYVLVNKLSCKSLATFRVLCLNTE